LHTRESCAPCSSHTNTLVPVWALAPNACLGSSAGVPVWAHPLCLLGLIRKRACVLFRPCQHPLAGLPGSADAAHKCMTLLLSECMTVPLQDCSWPCKPMGGCAPYSVSYLPCIQMIGCLLPCTQLLAQPPWPDSRLKIACPPGFSPRFCKPASWCFPGSKPPVSGFAGH